MTINKFITFCFVTSLVGSSLNQSCASDLEGGGVASVEAAATQKASYTRAELEALQFSPLSQAMPSDEEILNMLRAGIYAGPETPHVLELKTQVAAEKIASRRVVAPHRKMRPSFGFATGGAAADKDWRATKAKRQEGGSGDVGVAVEDASATATPQVRRKSRHRGGKKERVKRERRAAAEQRLLENPL